MKWWIWIVLAIVLLLPIGINFLMLVAVKGVSVAGTTGNWIGFWGSYAGGCITALISFVILYRTIEHNKQENLLRLQETHKERLRTELSSRLAYLNTKKFTVYYERLLEGQSPQELCKIVEGTRVQIVNDFSSFKILYSGIYDAFILRYDAITWSLESHLSWLSDALSQIPEQDTPSRRATLEKAKDRFERLAALQPRIDEFWVIASNMIN